MTCVRVISARRIHKLHLFASSSSLYSKEDREDIKDTGVTFFSSWQRTDKIPCGMWSSANSPVKKRRRRRTAMKSHEEALQRFVEALNFSHKAVAVTGCQPLWRWASETHIRTANPADQQRRNCSASTRLHFMGGTGHWKESDHCELFERDSLPINDNPVSFIRRPQMKILWSKWFFHIMTNKVGQNLLFQLCRKLSNRVYV